MVQAEKRDVGRRGDILAETGRDGGGEKRGGGGARDGEF